MADSLRALGREAIADVGKVIEAMPDDAADGLVEAIVSARRIAIHGLGREGLAIKGFAMRLFHMGRDVHVVGDMTTPPLAEGDLLIVSVGPGALRTVDTLMEIAASAGARTAVVTAQPDGPTSQAADILTVIPAQTMANDQGGGAVSVLPMGSLFEIAEAIFFELVVLRLREAFGETAETMRARHTNLE